MASHNTALVATLLLILSPTVTPFTFLPNSAILSNHNGRRIISKSNTPFYMAPPQTGPNGQPAKTPEEDLELTREIIMSHIEKYSDNDFLEEGKGEEEKVEDVPKNDLMIRAALGQNVERTPVWLFRQAGRHLPEYTAYKQKVGRSFLEMLSFPEDVAECTMQPIRRYPVDAAILFSDILVIAEALNIEVTMPGGVGILIPQPLASPEDMAERIPSISTIDKSFVEKKLGHVLESVRLIRAKMAEEQISIPLIGFSAAPWTLLFYMVGGSSKRNKEIGMTWLKEHPEASKKLLDLLTKIVIEYCSCQVEQGVHLVQIFEAMGMMIDEEHFDEFALPCLEEISVEMKKRFPDVPLMVFSRGASFANEKLSKMSYDIVTIDGEVKRDTARSVVDGRAGLQGNYDPRELIENEEGTKTPETVRETVKDMLTALGPQRLIANLGEGLGGKESTDLVAAFVDSVHEESEAMIGSSE